LTKRCQTLTGYDTVEDVDGMVTSKLKDFRESLLADLGHILLNKNSCDSSYPSMDVSPSQPVSG